MDRSSHKSVSQWIADLKEGDPDAARKLEERYFGRLVALARQKLGNAPRRAADEEDVAQDVFFSLCRGAERGRFPKLSDRGDLWGLLLRITEHKAADQIKHQKRRKRGGGVVRGESVFNRKADEEGQPAGIDQVMDAAPTPQTLAQLDEALQHRLGLLDQQDPSGMLRNVALWKLEGHSNEEIAKKLECVPRTVERKLELIRKVWSKGPGDGSGPIGR